ncbi:MAG: glycosyltransferase [Gammaproteobacteria bacterium]|nr:glycosyltransferase family 4 protein [Gammaproteobacteria bacterium]NNJ91179.1 glycosyltransferase [Gammaproteobacteria bacterium]
MMEIIQVLQSAQWRIVFATPAADSPYKADLKSLHIPQQSIELNSDSFDEWIHKLSPDAVLFDRFMMEEQFGWRVARSCPDAMRILDTEDLHFLRQGREAVVRQKHSVDISGPGNETALREIASIYRSDLSLIISSKEMLLLKQDFKIPDQLLHYFPFVTEQPSGLLPGFAERKDFLFVGTARHAPNLDAIRYLKTTLWPAIRKQLPATCLNIVGSYPTKEISQMHKPETGFCVLGHVENLQPLLESSRVFLAPLRFGAGLKGKLIEAMQWGIPSVTTSTGAEGIASADGWPGIVVDNDSAFISAAVDIYESETRWKQAQQTGLSLLHQHFERTQHSRKLSERITEVIQQLQKHRATNFTGQMLLHHSMRSTEFMSRWIDCKNQKSSTN